VLRGYYIECRINAEDTNIYWIRDSIRYIFIIFFYTKNNI